MTPPVVPFPREIRLGTVGKDVIAHKRALSRWDPSIYPWQQFSSYAGPYFINAITVFKDRHGLGTAPKIGGRAYDTYLDQLGIKYPNPPVNGIRKPAKSGGAPSNTGGG